MGNLKGTQTEKNIAAAFAGESQARSRYTYFAEKAQEEGREGISTLFKRMAENECAHAKIWFKIMCNNTIPDTDANLLDAISRENSEWLSMYPDFAKQARQEGFEDVAVLFEKIAAIEEAHERQFMEALLGLSPSTAKPALPKPSAVKTVKTTVWRCELCGELQPFSPNAEIPYTCPTCGALGHFEKVVVDMRG